MCYAIPGKVVEINGSLITLEYFGERRKARNEFYTLSPGEYVYAQGGVVIQKIAEREALPILETWQELFFKLRETDLRLAREDRTLYGTANTIRQKKLGNATCVHGILEFSNYCGSDCLYCGLRKSRSQLRRYRMNVEEILAAADYAVNKLGFKALVLQSGEDPWYDTEKLSRLVKEIRNRCGLLLILSIGERDMETYKRLYDLGSRGVLLRFETSRPDLYQRIRPGHILEKRLKLIRELGQLGYLIMTGFLIGLPDQTEEDIWRDIELTQGLGAEMFSFGPFIPHPETPLAKTPAPSLDLVLRTIARTRILYPEAKILVTTALETLDKKDGARRGLLAGANSLMIDITPRHYRELYELYPHRAGTEIDVAQRIKEVIELLHSLGRAPTDLGL